jgi:hypothetical protein
LVEHVFDGRVEIPPDGVKQEVETLVNSALARDSAGAGAAA